MHRVWGAVTAALTVPLLLFPNSSELPPGFTGHAGEQSCTACHTGGSARSGVTIAFPDGPRYRPGRTQRLQILIDDWQSSRFGFQLTARDTSNRQSGTFTPADDSTKVLCGSGQPRSAEGCPGVEYIQHSRPSSSNTIAIDWTPPAQYSGPIRFDVAAVSADGDASPAGDEVFQSSTTVTNGFGYQFQSIVRPGASQTTPIAINNSGTVLGRYQTQAGASGFFLLDKNGTFQDIAVPGADPSLLDLNNRGQIVGNTHFSGVKYGFLRSPAGALSYDPAFSSAIAINDKGDHVGPYGLLKGGVNIPLPPIRMIQWHWHATPTAVSLNSAGEVVGSVQYTFWGSPASTGGFRLSPAGVYSYFDGIASDINNAGLIASNGESYADLGTPPVRVPNVKIVSLNDAANVVAVTANGAAIGTPCRVVVIGSKQVVGPAGVTGRIDVSAEPGCAWGSSAPEWITVVQEPSFVSYTVGPNHYAAARTGALIVAGVEILFEQSVAPCSFTVPSSITVLASGQDATASVETGANCSWTAVSTSPWIVIQPPATRAGSASINFKALPNQTGAARVAQISVGDRLITIEQPAASSVCNVIPSPASLSVGPSAASTRIALITTPGCAWTATSSAAWIKTSSQGSGTGKIELSIDPLSGVATRESTIHVLGTAIPIRQTATPEADRVGFFDGGRLAVDDGNVEWGNPQDREGSFGSPGDVPLTGDWTGTKVKRLAVFRDGQWFFDDDGNLLWTGEPGHSFGMKGDLPLVGDWFATGHDHIAVFRNGGVFLDLNRNRVWDPADLAGNFGQAGDVPFAIRLQPGGPQRIGVFRHGSVFIDQNGDLQWNGPAVDLAGSFGMAGDIPMVADWVGNGTQRLAVFRSGQVFIDWNGNLQWDGPQVDRMGTFGQAGDLPLWGDWDGSGKVRVGVFRPGASPPAVYLDWNGNLQFDSSGADAAGYLGTPGAKPITIE